MGLSTCCTSDPHVERFIPARHRFEAASLLCKKVQLYLQLKKGLKALKALKAHKCGFNFLLISHYLNNYPIAPHHLSYLASLMSFTKDRGTRVEV